MKMTFFSSVMLWMLYKWYKKRQLTDVFIPSISNQNQNFFKIFLILCSHVKPKASSVSIQCDSADMTSIKILYGSVTGKAKYFAHQFQKQCTARGFSSTRVIDLKDYEPEDSLMNDVKSKTIFVVFISTYTEGACPENAKWFHKYITEMAHDFRFEKDALAGLSYSVCGLGNSLYAEHFNTVAIELDKSLHSLHAHRIAPLYCCDENTIRSKHSSLEGDVEFWQNNFFEKLSYHLRTKKQVRLFFKSTL